MEIHSIPGKLVTTWEASVRTVVDSWTSYDVTLAEFKTAVLDKGLSYAKAHNGQAWIVDSSKAKGNFTTECQNCIASDIFPSFAKSGIKYFITIKSGSALTNLTIKTYQAQTGPHGLKLVEMPNVAAAIEWLKANAA
jgi:hypothetical protein